jgi:hypothetical protein
MHICGNRKITWNKGSLFFEKTEQMEKNLFGWGIQLKPAPRQEKQELKLFSAERNQVKTIENYFRLN